ncbi:19146_t:CDS:2, partial [Gigaspora rosea]
MFDAQDIIDKYSPEPNSTFDESNPTFDESNSIFDESSSTSDESSSTSDESSSISDESSLLSDESGSTFKEFNPVFDEQDITDQKDTCKFDQIFEESMLENYEAVNEYLRDDSECSDIDKIDNAEFSSIAYRDFVEIIIKYQLSYTAGDAVLKFIRKHGQLSNKALPRSTKDSLLFLDTLKKSYTNFFSTPVVQVKGQVYSFEYRPIILAVKKILQDSKLAESCVFDYKEIYSSIGEYQEREYSEFYNCEWWGRAQQFFISLGNISTKLRNKPEAKALVGIIPTLQGTKEERQTSQFRQLIRMTFHKCMNVLFAPLRLQYHSGVLLKVSNCNLRCNLMLSCVIGDWPENCKSCLTYNGTSCSHPCHTCLIEKDKLNTIKLPSNRMIIRTENQMKQIIELKQGKDYSLHKEINSFWNYFALVNKMDLRLGLILRYPGLKIFNSGLADLALFIAFEYKHMMKVMPFVLEGLLLDEKKDESLVQIFVIRMLTHKEVYECIVLQNNQPKINTGKFEILEGLLHFIPALNNYFDLTFKKNISESEITLILFEFFKLPNKEQVRATKNYYNNAMFSNIAIYMDTEQEIETCGGYCFAKVLLLVHVVLKNGIIFNLALVRWYDFKFSNAPSKFYKLG